MKCFIKSLLGQDDSFNETNANNMDETCVALPPIVKSLIGSVLFLTLMTIISHMVRI